MLRTALGGHPNLVCLPEIFNPDWIKGAPFDANTDEQTILDRHVFCDYPPSITAVGFALHRSGARFGNWPGLWQRLIADERLHVISLRRNHLLRRYLSWRTIWEPKADPPQPKLLGADELRAEFERHEGEICRFDRAFASHPLLRVSYEALCADYAATLERVQTFLGVPPAKLTPGTARNRPWQLAEAIANFDELADIFAATRWAGFFGRGSALIATATVDLPGTLDQSPNR